ncbi:MAG: hypothetical protein K2H56_00270 [Malacoplasma sp.]|nr:hypothetical protein [Malacoplasma sp.]MDE5774882.1 hypothetical protein [Malacoplasma sp.]
MSKKLKILFSFGIVATAAGSGIAPTMVTKTSVQSSTIAGDDYKNPDNPDKPVQILTYAPETDIFIYEIDFTEEQNNENLNNVLKNLFTDESILSSESKYLLNANEYENVKLVYVENSANFVENTFNISVTPNNGAKWESGKSDSKIIVCKISNLKLLAHAEAPTIANISNGISGNFASNKDLENYLVKNYWSLKFAAESGVNFTNTLNEYIQNSANLKDKTFKIKVWPQEQHSWKDGTGRVAKEILVNIPNLTQESSSPNNPQVVHAPIFWTVNSTILSNYKETWNGWKWAKPYLIFGLNASENDWILQTIFENAMKDY